MKKIIINILSYLWLLLLMAVTACSDMEREVDEMQQQLQDADQVELTIHTQVPRMKAGTRAVNGDNLTSVTALAFDKDGVLIKVVSPTTITQNENDNNESGSFTVKVPLRTRSVHFLGNYTLNSGYTIGETTAETLLSSLTTTDTNNLYYWGMETFADATALKNYSDKVNLYRDKALITLNSTIGQSDYIAGLVNYNQSGKLVPGGNFEVGTLNAVSSVASHTVGNLGTETYVYEHANTDSHLYAICCIDGLFYKVAFATNTDGVLSHFSIIRNHKYNINIKEIETALGSDGYDEALGREPINNAVVEEVELSLKDYVTELYYNNDRNLTVTASIPEGVSALTITAANFDVTTTSELVTEKSGYTYTVNSTGDVVFTFTLKDGSYTDNETVTIQFAGTPEYGYELTNPEAISVTLRDNIPPLGLEIIAADPTNPSLTYGPNSIEDLQVKLTIPAGVTSLTFSSDDFTIRQATDKKKGETAYLSDATEVDNTRTYVVNNVTEPTILPFLLRLKNGVEKESATFTFSGSGEGLQDSSVEGSVTLTAREPDDETIYWEGYLPLDLEDNTTKLSIPKSDLTVNKILVIECTEPTNDGTFEVLYDGLHFDPRLEYNTATAEVQLTQDLLDLITEKIIITGRTNADMTLLKVSMVPLNKILITAPGAAEGVSDASVKMSYSNQSAIEEYSITVTVPDGVTQLNYTNTGFSNVYIDNENGWYNEVPQTIDTSNNKDIALKLLVNKEYNANPTITFSAANVESATFTVNRTAGEPNANVLWEGALQFQGYAVNVSKIAIPNSLLQGKLLDGAVLTLEYEVVNDNNDFITICGSGLNSWANLNNMAEDGEYTDNNSSMITMTLNPTIIENIGSSDLNMQGNGRVLEKVTLTPPNDVSFKILEENVSLDLTTNNTVLHIQKPANVTQLTITDNENLFGAVSTTFANANVNGKTISNLPNYAATIPVELEITQVVDIKDYTITVSDGNGNSDDITIELLSTWSGSFDLGNWSGLWKAARKLPVGSTVQITFADYSGCKFELHTYDADGYGYDIRLPGYSTNEENENHISSDYIKNDVFSFTVATDGTVLIMNNGSNNVTETGIDGLQINGGDGLSITQVNVILGGGQTSAGFTYDFEDDVKFGGWNNNITTEIVTDPDQSNPSNKVLKIVVSQNEYNFGQLGVDGDYSENCTYSLSLKFRAESTNGTKMLVFQKKVTEGDYPIYATLSISNYITANSWEEYIWENVNLTGYADQFVIKFENVEANATFYIDDLKLVRNNQ